jgi:hypothetical protein
MPEHAELLEMCLRALMVAVSALAAAVAALLKSRETSRKLLPRDPRRRDRAHDA